MPSSFRAARLAFLQWRYKEVQVIVISPFVATYVPPVKYDPDPALSAGAECDYHDDAEDVDRTRMGELEWHYRRAPGRLAILRREYDQVATSIAARPQPYPTQSELELLAYIRRTILREQERYA